jgi:hypothetical protein
MQWMKTDFSGQGIVQTSIALVTAGMQVLPQQPGCVPVEAAAAADRGAAEAATAAAGA